MGFILAVHIHGRYANNNRHQLICCGDTTRLHKKSFLLHFNDKNMGACELLHKMVLIVIEMGISILIEI